MKKKTLLLIFLAALFCLTKAKAQTTANTTTALTSAKTWVLNKSFYVDNNATLSGGGKNKSVSSKLSVPTLRTSQTIDNLYFGCSDTYYIAADTTNHRILFYNDNAANTYTPADGDTCGVLSFKIPAGSGKLFIRSRLGNKKGSMSIYLNQDRKHSIANKNTDWNNNEFEITVSTETSVYIVSTANGSSGNQIDTLTWTPDEDSDNNDSAFISTTSYLTSFSSSSNVTVPDGVTIYKASAPSDNKVTLSEVNTKVIPAYTGVILYKQGGGDVALDYGGDPDASLFSDNALKPTTGYTVTGDGTSKYYVLVKDAASMAPLASGTTMTAGKAYLPTNTSTGAKLNFDFGNTVTGINGIETGNHKSQFSNLNSQTSYNLAGQRVDSNYKGIVIVNGKKILRK